MKILKCFSIGSLLWTCICLQAFTQPVALPEDVTSIDGIITAYYEVVSGPAGQPRDWARDSTLHIPGAQVLIVRNNPDGSIRPGKMTLADYHKSGNSISETGFFEYEINRVTSQHGAIAHVWSTYEWRTTKNGPVGGRGINSIQLVHDGNRWWISSWMFDGRTNAPEVPEAYLPKQ